MGAGDTLEANLIADGLANGLAKFGGNATGSQTGGDAARFENEDGTGQSSEQRGGNTRGFARTRGGFKDERGVLAERSNNVGE